MGAVVLVNENKVNLSSRQWLLLLSVVLACIGLIMVASASTDVAQVKYNSPFFFVQRQAIFLLAGLVMGALTYQIPLSVWQKNGAFLLFVGIGLLVLLLVGFGKTVNGSTRWIPLGPINVQVSEIVKLCAVTYVAGYLVRRVEEVRQQFWGFAKPLLVLAVMMALLVKQPDYGSVVVIMGAVFAMLFLAGVRLQHLIGTVAVFGSLGGLMVYSSGYHKARVIGYLDPWQHQYSDGYQLVQSLIAFGRGEWFGIGLGNSLQKLSFLPEAHTDFVFAILAEEFGFLGNLVVIFLFVALVLIALSIGRQAEKNQKPFNGYLVYGLSVLIGLQVLINIGVSSGLLPTKGLTLPLISYGGSSLVIVCIWLALIMRADYENQTPLVEQKQTKSSKAKAGTKVGKKRAKIRKEPVL